jgi:hypothetical protein
MRKLLWALAGLIVFVLGLLGGVVAFDTPTRPSPRFAENGIDVSVLRYLTDQDLEKDRRSCSAIDERCWRRLRSLWVPSKHRRSLR